MCPVKKPDCWPVPGTPAESLRTYEVGVVDEDLAFLGGAQGSRCHEAVSPHPGLVEDDEPHVEAGIRIGQGSGRFGAVGALQLEDDRGACEIAICVAKRSVDLHLG